MTTLTRTEAPIFVPSRDDDIAERRADRNGWIVVLLAAALAATLLAFAHRVDPRTLPDEPTTALVD